MVEGIAAVHAPPSFSEVNRFGASFTMPAPGRFRSASPGIGGNRPRQVSPLQNPKPVRDARGARWWMAGHDPPAPENVATTLLSLANLLLNLQKSAGELPASSGHGSSSSRCGRSDMPSGCS
jgi:hypothetical protein